MYTSSDFTRSINVLGNRGTYQKTGLPLAVDFSNATLISVSQRICEPAFEAIVLGATRRFSIEFLGH